MIFFKMNQPKLMPFLKNFLLLFFLLINLCSSCQPSEKTASNQEKSEYSQNEENSTENRPKKYRKRLKRENDENDNSKYTHRNHKDSNKSEILTGNVPEKALKVLKYVREYGVAKSGYVGGRRFGNFEGLIPKKDASGKRIEYQEWDVNPKVQGKNRGAERLVTGSDGKGYYTNDHYRSFLFMD
jgi:hypothetical protein